MASGSPPLSKWHNGPATACSSSTSNRVSPLLLDPPETYSGPAITAGPYTTITMQGKKAMSGFVRWFGLSALAVLATINAAAAETVAEFYAGKTFTIVVGSDVGG